MKLLFLLLLSTPSFCQKVITKSPKDTTIKSDSEIVYQGQWSQKELSEIIDKLKNLDEKPSTISSIITPIIDKIKPVKIKK